MGSAEQGSFQTHLILHLVREPSSDLQMRTKKVGSAEQGSLQNHPIPHLVREPSNDLQKIFEWTGLDRFGPTPRDANHTVIHQNEYFHKNS